MSNTTLQTQHTRFYWNQGKPLTSSSEKGHAVFPTSSLLRGQGDASTHRAEHQPPQSERARPPPSRPAHSDGVSAGGAPGPWTMLFFCDALLWLQPACNHAQLPRE